MNAIKIAYGRTIWYDDSIIETVEMKIGDSDRNYIHDLDRKIKKAGYQTELENVVWFGASNTTCVITYSAGKTVIVSCESEKTVIIVAKVKTEKVESFEFFDDIHAFERFYKMIVKFVQEINSEYDDAQEDTDEG